MILLDGAMGTELAARGFGLEGPLHSGRALLDAPELVARIHLEYVLAGAQILSTNSFGLHVASLARAGMAERQGELAARSVELLEHVRQLVRSREGTLSRFRVAGSIPPRPAGEGEEDPALAAAEYRCLAEALIRAGADLILLETFTSLAQVRVALDALTGIELPIWVAVSAGLPQLGQPRPDGSRLISGDEIASLGDLPVDALLVNCTQIDAIPAALAALTSLEGPALGFYPHLGKRRYDGVWIEQIVDPEVFAEQMEAWVQRWPGVSLAGACCGSSPAYIAALKRQLQPDEDARERSFIELAQLVP